MIGSFKGRISLMKGNQHRYPENWSEIALAIKQAAHWRCAKCGVQCIKPGDKTTHLSRGERMASTLQVHHANYLPEDNRPENLIPLCSGCHGENIGFVSPGAASSDGTKVNPFFTLN